MWPITSNHRILVALILDHLWNLMLIERFSIPCIVCVWVEQDNIFVLKVACLQVNMVSPWGQLEFVLVPRGHLCSSPGSVLFKWTWLHLELIIFNALYAAWLLVQYIIHLEKKSFQSSSLLAICGGNHGGFSSQRASNAESISMSWHLHVVIQIKEYWWLFYLTISMG